MAQRIYTPHEGDRPYAALDIERMSAEEQVRVMVSWFHENYENPAERLPHNSREGGYQWIFGGPTSPDEALQEEFSSFVEYQVIQRAVEELEAEGLEWSPIPDDEDFLDDEEQSNSELLSVLADLRARLEEQLPAPGIGHNQPPEEIEDAPLTTSEIKNAIEDASTVIDFAAGSEENKSNLIKALQSLGKASSVIASWVGERATNGVDAFIKGAATAAGAATVISWDRIASLMERAIELAASIF